MREIGPTFIQKILFLIIYSSTKSVSVKGKVLSEFIKKMDPAIKTKLHLKYKIHRNLMSSLLKRT